MVDVHTCVGWWICVPDGGLSLVFVLLCHGCMIHWSAFY